jgi:hypothetical protein
MPWVARGDIVVSFGSGKYFNKRSSVVPGSTFIDDPPGTVVSGDMLGSEILAFTRLW